MGKVIGILIAFFVLIMIMKSGRRMKYRCANCGHSWKWRKHHGQTAPTCPKCGSPDISRRNK